MKKPTQAQKTIEYLLTYRAITYLEMASKLYINSPRDVMKEVKNSGLLEIKEYTKKTRDGRPYKVFYI